MRLTMTSMVEELVNVPDLVLDLDLNEEVFHHFLTQSLFSGENLLQIFPCYRLRNP